MTQPENKPVIHKGLVGTFVDYSTISNVMDNTDSLTYRGYAVEDLSEHCRFEEVAYLMWNGELPDAQQLKSFEAQERGLRALDKDVIALLKKTRKDAHPMDVLRTAISYIGMQDPTWADATPQGNKEKALNMLAKAPVITAAFMRIRKGLAPIAPRDDLSYSENFFHMCFGKVPEPAIVKAFDTTMILYAEHSFNVSTFTARTITSSLSDIYSAVTGGIGSLKGPLHGGANEAVMHMIDEIGKPENAEKWLRDALAQKKVVMGFGHRVYKNGDSRVPTLKKCFNEVAKLRNGEDLLKITQVLEDIMVREKKVHPNVDFPTGPLYNMMGFDTDMFTPFFVMARISGWTAHVMEQLDGNKLIRPLCVYSGEEQRPVPPMGSRAKSGPATPKRWGE